MPPLPPAPLTIKAVVEGTISGTPFANIFHFEYSHDPPTIDQMNQVANTVGSNYVSNVLVLLGIEAQTTQCVATDLNTDTGNVGVAGIPAAGSSGGAVPAIACVLVKHTIARRYRGGHPRTYLPPFANSQLLDAQHWKSDQVASMSTNYAAFITAITSSDISTTLGGLIYVNTSYFSHNALRVTPVNDPILASAAEVMVASQRRRIGR